MKRWVYWVSLGSILAAVTLPIYGILTDPQGSFSDLFKLGIDLQGGTSLIYELRAPEGGAEAPDARDAKRVITGRIDPQGTRGYTVRAIGKHRLEIVLPGRATRVKIDEETVSRENLAAAQQAAAKQSRMTADLIQEKSDAFLSGARLVVRMTPPLYLDDIQSRLGQALRERKAGDRPPVAIVGLEPEKEQWKQIVIFIGARFDDKARLAEWEDTIRSALASQQDVTRVKRLVRQAGFLEFRILADKVKDRDKANFDQIVRDKQAGKPSATQEFRWYPLRRGYEWYKDGLLDAWNYVYVIDKERQEVEVLVNVGDSQDVSGRDLSRAFASSNEGDPIVSFALKPTAGARFARLTRPEMVGRYLAIILDGTVQSAPVLRATLSTGGIIEGYRNNERERDEVVTILNSGQLSASLGDPVTERTVGPELGADNIHKGFQASAIGFALVLLFMGVYYRFAGLVANTALVLNLVLTICLMYLIRQAWTLPGIAGLLLSLAMAVDANVLIYERLREEKGKEGSLAFALKKAYERAFTTIFDSNLTTVIPAFVLLLPGLATEEVKGFAVVMIIGIGISMFTAVVVTRMIFETGMKLGLVKEIKMFQLLRRPNIDWMRFGRWAFVISTSLGLLGVVAFLSRGEDKYDIEFVGGTQVEMALKPAPGQTSVPIDKVRTVANQALGGMATVQELEYAKENPEHKVSRFLISVPAIGQTAGEARVSEALGKAFADMRPETGDIAAKATASEITEAVVYEYLAAQGGTKPAAPPAEKPPAEKPAAGAPAAATEPPAVRFIPRDERQYLGKIRLLADVAPALPAGEVQRRMDAFIRDRFPDLVGTPYRVMGKTPGDIPGEFKTFDLWVQQPFTGKRAETDNPVLWADIVGLSLGAKQAFASTTSFEASMAGEAWHKAVIAILFSLAAMTFYIWIRFAKLASGLAAVIALIHDVMITLGAVSIAAVFADTWFGTSLLLSDMKINLPLVGAFLTLVGYSVNDTIVVFDRIRENRGKYGDLSISVVNTSINQTLSRTVLTSFTVFVAVVALYFFGGKTSSIHGLAFVMLFGTLVGTYSSIAIASPILVMKDYLMKIYTWAYPILTLGVLAYYIGVWKTPGEFFGSPGGWVWAILMLGWLAVSWWAVRDDFYGRPWGLPVKAPGLAKVVAYISLLAPLATVGLFAAAVLATKGSGVPAWAGPGAFAALAACPATYGIWRGLRHMPAQAGQSNQILTNSPGRRPPI